MSFREFYARLITASVKVENERIAQAFADTRREEFLPSGPWQVLVPVTAALH